MPNRSFYEMIAPDFGDPEQQTTTNPGLILEVVERDGGIGIGLSTIDRRREGFHMCHINPDEAEELVRGLEEAIKFTRQKVGNGPGWPRRVRPT